MAASIIPVTKLNSGYELPVIGYGTYGGPNAPQEVYQGSKVALELGYRHFDTAYNYNTEASLAKAIKESGVPREQLFLTTKLWNTFHEPERVKTACLKSLRKLETDYLDLYLMHWPVSWPFNGYECEYDNLRPWKDGKIENIGISFIDTYKAMEQLVKEGLVRSIGVSNFTIPKLKALLEQCEIPPAVNQVELHPFLPQEELLSFCKEHNIHVTAFSPLSNPGIVKGKNRKTSLLEEPRLIEIAKKYGKSPGQTALNWGVQRGYSIVPKSVTPARIKANMETFPMAQEDIDYITQIGRDNPIRVCNSIYLWGPEHAVFDDE
ncbi:NADP-dependent oxidoreductase domain-containing protein [Umbelopsis sp. PMI_123]|nr:NADP-dependent oxidoreductase domain-containing protein [Umbelopsis sp. PMI_123]